MKKIVHKRLFLLIMTSIIAMAVLVGCQSKDDNENEAAEPTPVTIEDIEIIETDAVPEVTIEMENGGKMIAELYPNIAPNAVNNFISLISDGFYDGVIFHRVIPGFMIQGGDPDGLGTGGPGYSIPGEFANNNFANDLKHERGVLSMARSQHPDSAGSQFFIMTDNSPHLDSDYAGFGKVVEGMDVADDIVNSETAAEDKPVEDQVIKKVTVELNGYDAKEPLINKN